MKEEYYKKFFGIGLGRTGTKSLYQAFQILGYNSVHAPKDIDDIWSYRFAADLFVATRYRFLDYVYPHARFILTTRDIDSWIASCGKFDEAKSKGGRPTKYGVFNIPHRRAETRYMAFGICHFDEGVFREKFVEFHEGVIEHFRGREDKLLVMDICAGDGWEKLCGWLNMPVPDISFPHRNKSA